MSRSPVTFRATVLEAFRFDYVAWFLIPAAVRFFRGSFRAWALLTAVGLTIWLACWLRTWVRVLPDGTVEGRYRGERFEVLGTRIEKVQWWSMWGMSQAWLKTTTGETHGLPASVVRCPAFQELLPGPVTRHDDPREAKRQARILGITLLLTIVLPLVLLTIWQQLH